MGRQRDVDYRGAGDLSAILSAPGSHHGVVAARERTGVSPLMRSPGTTVRRWARPKATAKVVRNVWHHPANADRRTRAMLRLIRAESTARLTNRPVIVNFGNHSKVVTHLHVGGSWRAVYANPPDYPEMTAWSKLLAPGDIFVDVGANAGLYTVWAIDLGAKPIAIEPSHVMMGHLQANIAINAADVEVIESAVSDESGMAYLGGPDYLRNRLSSQPVASVEGPAGDRVAVSTLDTIVADRCVRGVKIDVEGYERKVLQGAARLLSEHRVDVLQLEWNNTSVDALNETRKPVAAILSQHGYVLCRPCSRGLLRPCATTDFGPDMFAVSSNRASELLH